MKNQKKNLKNAAAISGAILGGTLIGMNPLNASSGSMFESSDLGTGAEIRADLFEMNKAVLAAEGISIIKFSELKCGEGKCGEGKCGDEKKKEKTKEDASTTTETKTESAKKSDVKSEKTTDSKETTSENKKEVSKKTSDDSK